MLLPLSHLNGLFLPFPATLFKPKAIDVVWI
nr:MAG TPA: hypothetical protein [Caudoviricetes sp.]